MLRKFKNNASSKLASTLSDLGTTLVVEGGDGALFPAVASPNFFNVTLRDSAGNVEIVKVTERIDGQDSMTIARGQEGTLQREWIAGSVVSLRLTAAAIEGMATQSDPETLTNKTIGAGSDWNGNPIPIANGGTGATSIAEALDELGGQPLSDVLTSLAALATGPDMMFYTTAIDTIAELETTEFGRSLLETVDAQALYTILGLGDVETYGSSLLEATDAADARDTLGAAADASTQTVWIPAGAITPRVTNGATAVVFETLVNKVVVRTLDFAVDVDSYGQFTIRMPKGWDEGTVAAIFVWSHGETTTSFDAVWGIRALARSDSDALDVPFGTEATVTDTGGATDTLYQTAATAAVTIGGTPAENDMVTFQVARNGSNVGDTLAVSARLHGVVLLYQTASLNDA